MTVLLLFLLIGSLPYCKESNILDKCKFQNIFCLVVNIFCNIGIASLRETISMFTNNVCISNQLLFIITFLHNVFLLFE